MDDMMESDLEARVVVMPRRVTTDEDQFCWQCRWLNTMEATTVDIDVG